MSSRWIKPGLCCVACLLVGIGVGRLLPRASPETADAGNPKTAATIAKSNRQRADEPTAGGVPSNPSIRNAANPPEQPTHGQADAEPGTVNVPAALIRELSRAAGDRKPGDELFSRDGRIEEALGITEHEKAAIQTAWRATRQRIREAEAAAATSEEIDEWSVRISVPDLSQSLQSLGGDFRASVTRTLGGDRAEAFLAAKQVDRTFAPREGAQSYTVTTEETGDGNWRFRFTTEGPDGTRVWVGETIPDEIRHLTDAAGVNPSLGQ